MKKFLLLLLLPVMLGAQTWVWSGYAKYLIDRSKISFYGPGTLTDQQVHIRLNNRWYASENMTAILEFRMRAFKGESVKRIPGFTEQVVSAYPYADLSVETEPTGDFFAYGQVDRAALDYNTGNWEITIGRQRVAWGTSLVWNVVDLFNPQSVLDFDYEEKPGSDALRVQYFTGAVSRVEAVIKPAPKANDRTYALLWAANRYGFDFNAILAWTKSAPLFGAAFSGDVLGAGIRGEMRMVGKSTGQAPDDPRLAFGSGYKMFSSAYVSAVFSLDYTFPGSLYLHSEALYNSNGKIKNAVFYNLPALNAGLLSAARWSLFGEAAYDFHPLLRGDVFAMFNPNDHSYIWAPSLSWSVFTNLDVYVIGLISNGRPYTEFSAYGQAVFLRFKYSF